MYLTTCGSPRGEPDSPPCRRRCTRGSRCICADRSRSRSAWGSRHLAVNLLFSPRLAGPAPAQLERRIDHEAVAHWGSAYLAENFLFSPRIVGPAPDQLERRVSSESVAHAGSDDSPVSGSRYRALMISRM